MPRIVLTLLLVTQLIGVAVPLADALLERAAAHAVQVAAPGDGDAPSHVEGHCVLCQHLAESRTASGRTAVIEFALATTGLAVMSVAHEPAVAPLLLQRGRSPPAI